jgi:hypothetical protein
MLQSQELKVEKQLQAKIIRKQETGKNGTSKSGTNYGKRYTRITT